MELPETPECLELGATDILVVFLDVTDAEEVDRAVGDTVAAFGRIDALVPCAAVLACGRFETFPWMCSIR
jgi:NAD(P)-dependent dehydrogenase (short-subunit alcohol dehydrogenase family)